MTQINLPNIYILPQSFIVTRTINNKQTKKENTTCMVYTKTYRHSIFTNCSLKK